MAAPRTPGFRGLAVFSGSLTTAVAIGAGAMFVTTRATVTVGRQEGIALQVRQARYELRGCRSNGDGADGSSVRLCRNLQGSSAWTVMGGSSSHANSVKVCPIWSVRRESSQLGAQEYCTYRIRRVRRNAF
eukprot:1190513-Prorocentrum_minimum.AAC.1